MEVVEDRKTNDADSAAIKAQIEALASQGSLEELAEVVEQFVRQCPDQGQILLAEGVLAFRKQEHAECLAKLGRARDLLGRDRWPELTSVYTSVLVKVQLALPRRERPVAGLGYNHYKKNIAALREMDVNLAEQVQRSPWPERLVLVELWDGVYFCGVNQTLAVATQEVIEFLAEPVRGRKPIGFGGVGSGQEIRHALEHQVNLLYGMARAHYLFEPEVEMIRALLHMFDLTEALRSEGLIIFGGNDMSKRINEVFGSLRYAMPDVGIGDTAGIKKQIDEIGRIVVGQSPIQEAKDYFASEEFRARQRQIARGEVQPRVLVYTCRWTTFLKYCAADFEKAFAGLGCATRYIIEENDVQQLLPSLHWRDLWEFKPDVFFMVSHARPTLPYLPRELPVIGFVQDKCGPLVGHADLAEHIAPRDVFVCMVSEFKRFLENKHVPPEQVFVMPIPADETMFYPLDDEEPPEARFVSDVGFVKHGHVQVERVQETFVRNSFSKVKNARAKEHLEKVFGELYRSICFLGDKRHYEADMQRFVAERLAPELDANARRRIAEVVTQFYITVYSAAWRCRFLEAIDEAGIQLSLYGGGWEEHARLAHLGRGSVNRERELNYVYNFNRINLSINQSTTTHQRLSECGLAGGFMMVADHAVDKDDEPARRYFEADREVVFFDGRTDLIDKCRYYLEHDDERRDIARNMHRRAVAERTCRAGAETVLRRWRELLLLREEA